jgi:hypothetical protein
LLNLGVEGRSALLGTIVADIHRIKIRLPSGAEFDAEGSPADVKAQYDAFLELMKAAPQVPAKPAEAQENDKKNQSPMPPLGDGPEPDDALMKRIFDIATDGLVSLKVLPRGDNAQAQGLLLLLYGYRRISQIENVYAVTLSRAQPSPAFNSSGSIAPWNRTLLTRDAAVCAAARLTPLTIKELRMLRRSP